MGVSSLLLGDGLCHRLGNMVASEMRRRGGVDVPTSLWVGEAYLRYLGWIHGQMG